MTLGMLVNIDVDDLARAVDFYEAALGLTIGRRFGELAVEMIGGPSPIYLLKKAAGTPAISKSSPVRRDFGRHWTPVHLDFVVERIEPAVARAQAAGASLEQPIRTHEWGRIAVLADPFGHGFCLIEFLGRGYDAIATAG